MGGGGSSQSYQDQCNQSTNPSACNAELAGCGAFSGTQRAVCADSVIAKYKGGTKDDPNNHIVTPADAEQCHNYMSIWLGDMGFSSGTNGGSDADNAAQLVCGQLALPSEPAKQYFSERGVPNYIYNPGPTWRDNVLAFAQNLSLVDPKAPPQWRNQNARLTCIANISRAHFWGPNATHSTEEFADLNSDVNSEAFWRGVMHGDILSLQAPGEQPPSGGIAGCNAFSDELFPHYVPPVPTSIAALSLEFPNSGLPPPIQPVNPPPPGILPLLNPQTNTDAAGDYWYEINGQWYFIPPTKPDTPVQPSEWDEAILEFEALLSRFGWTPEGFWGFCGSVAVVGAGAWQISDRPIFATSVYAVGGFLSRAAWYYLRLSYYEALADLRNNYPGLLYSAAPAAITVGAIALEMALGVPDVITGYTFLIGAGVTIGVFVWKQFENTPIGRALSIVFSPLFSFLSLLFGDSGGKAQ